MSCPCRGFPRFASQCPRNAIEHGQSAGRQLLHQCHGEGARPSERPEAVRTQSPRGVSQHVSQAIVNLRASGRWGFEVGIPTSPFVRFPTARIPVIAPRFVHMCSTSPCGPGNAGFRTSPHAASFRGRISATRHPRLTESGAASRDHGNVLPSLGAFQVAVIRQLRQATRVLGRRGAAGFHQARKHEPQQGGADVHLILRWPNLGQPQDRPPRVGAFLCSRGGDPFHTQTPDERVA